MLTITLLQTRRVEATPDSIATLSVPSVVRDICRWQLYRCRTAGSSSLDDGPLDVVPVNGSPVDVKPVDGIPVDGSPVDVKPVDVKPVDVALADSGACPLHVASRTDCIP